LYHSVVQNATTLIPSIAMAGILKVIRSISAGSATISLPPTARGREWGKLSENIPHAPNAARQPFCTMIMNCTATTAVVTRNATILSLSLKVRVYVVALPCRVFWVKQTSRG